MTIEMDTERIGEIITQHTWAWTKATEIVYSVLLGEKGYSPEAVTRLVVQVAEALVEEREPGRSKVSFGLNDECRDMLAQAVYAIEADSFSRLTLWCEYEKREHKLEQISHGGSDTVGYIKVDGETMPVCVEVFFYRYRGHLIATYWPTSQVVDHRMVERWLQTWALKSTDAMNASHAIHHIDHMVEKRGAS